MTYNYSGLFYSVRVVLVTSYMKTSFLVCGFGKHKVGIHTTYKLSPESSNQINQQMKVDLMIISMVACSSIILRHICLYNHLGQISIARSVSGWGLCTRLGYDVLLLRYISWSERGYEKELFINYKPTNFGMEGR